MQAGICFHVFLLVCYLFFFNAVKVVMEENNDVRYVSVLSLLFGKFYQQSFHYFIVYTHHFYLNIKCPIRFLHIWYY